MRQQLGYTQPKLLPGRRDFFGSLHEGREDCGLAAPEFCATFVLSWCAAPTYLEQSV